MTETIAPRYAADLTTADVDALCAFVEEQLDTADARWDTTEGRAVVAVRLALSALAVDLRGRLERGHDGELQDAYDVVRTWGHLLSVAGPWREVPGYDTVRWAHIPYATPAAERIDAEIRARLDN